MTTSQLQSSPELQLPVKRPFDWRVFVIVWIAAVLGLVAVLPYSLTLQSATLEALDLPIPLPLLLVIQVGQNAILFAVAAGVGYLLAARIGLGLPFIEKALQRTPIWHLLPKTALIAAILGVIGAALIIVLDLVIFAPQLNALLSPEAAGALEAASPPAWQGFLASFYGGISEEVLLRFFALSLIAWIGHFVNRTEEGRPGLAVLWIANILTAVLFGLGHLPATAAAGIPITTIVIIRAIVLNGLIGVIAGWLYWSRGLESAIIAHFAADLVLHVLLPLIGALQG